MKKKYNIWLIGIVLLIGILYVGTRGGFLQQFVCTTFSYQECSNWVTEHDTCYNSCQESYTNDCNKCGSTITGKEWANYLLPKLPRDYPNVFKNNQICCQKDVCRVRVWYSDATHVLGQASYVNPSGSDYYNTAGVYETVWLKDGECKSVNDVLPTGLTSYNHIKTCNSCQKTVQCNPYNCNSREVCSNWVTKTGSSVPSGTQNSQCVDGFESCGNSQCESQYDETEENCPADCSIKICSPGETQCDGNTLRTCSSKQTSFEFKKECLYGCSLSKCLEEAWICLPFGTCSEKIQTRTCVNQLFEQKTESQECEEPEIWVCGDWSNCADNHRLRNCTSSLGDSRTEQEACVGIEPSPEPVSDIYIYVGIGVLILIALFLAKRKKII